MKRESLVVLTFCCSLAFFLYSSVEMSYGEDMSLEDRVVSALKQTDKDGPQDRILLDRKALPIIRSILGSPDDYDTYVVKRSLAVIGKVEGATKDAPLRDRIEKLLKSKDHAIRRRAVMALGRVGVSENVPALLDTLSDTKESVRIQSATAIGRIGSESALAVLDQWKRNEQEADKARKPKDRKATKEVVAAINKAINQLKAKKEKK